ncbi:NAD-glutamate dehydrogenase [Nocardia sp. NPDC052566]|uniref:NAD-glutamate dehydrogenase n=1 Tax=Nocardia sp. NPDC052566 TaxID=3364330 RepID=UPI0037C5B69A
MAVTTRKPGRVGSDPHGLAAAYFRWIRPDATVLAIADRAGKIVDRHLELADVRRTGSPAIRVYRPGDDSGLGAAIQIVNDDMPLLVDSVTSALQYLGAKVTEVIHPIFDVARDEQGRAREIVAADTGRDSASTEGMHRESWMHLQLGQPVDGALLDRIEAAVPPLLEDLRRVHDDTPAMVDAVHALADRLDRVGDEEMPECARLLRWLADGRFTVLGYGYYLLRRSAPRPDAELDAWPLPGSALGVLRDESAAEIPLPVFGAKRPVLRVTSGLVNSLLPGSRDAHFISIADYGADESERLGPAGDTVALVKGEHVIVGTFTVAGLHENILDIPVVAQRVHEVIDWAGFELNSFSGQAMLEVMQSFPRTELFATDIRRLFEMVSAVANLGLRRRLQLFVRQDVRAGAIHCLVYLPRDRYSTEVRLRMQDVLAAEFDAEQITFSARASESELAVVYFTIHRRFDEDGQVVSESDRERIQELLFATTRTWADRLIAEAATSPGVSQALAQEYASAFPGSYQQEHEPARAVGDLRRLEPLGVGDIDVDLHKVVGSAPGTWRFVLYVNGDGVSLSRVLPVLQSLGVEVVDERPYPIVRRDGSTRWIYDFGLRVPTAPFGDVVDLVEGDGLADPSMLVPGGDVRQRVAEAVVAMWTGRAEVDGLNELILSAGLDWREVTMLRAYAKYLRQAGFAYAHRNIIRVLLAGSVIARLFAELFAAYFDPDRADAAAAEPADRIASRVRAEIDAVMGLDADRILRAMLSLITATLRTNFYRRGDDAKPPEYLSFKFDSREIDELPRPKPQFEIFVYSPRVEGVHLRFGSVARGGLRWSDRLEDFRTEILGLVKAQAVKNAVIVPVGAKGGFVVKQPPSATGDPVADRQALAAEGVVCYRTFISGLLDVTDNVDHASGGVVPPPRVVRRDGDDTYLVVAADKGTATYSDIANEVAASYGFWLGDAFASGGSAGYDHKAMGITAKGAWESVKRHFAEMDRDTQTTDFTVVGVGDMSGDVFGNGMLLSEHIHLVAAFDHRHIFLDPHPDASASYRERQRIFALPRSSWADYDNSLISAGGGVYDRTAKLIPVSPEVRTVLGIDSAVTALAPPKLIQAILRAPVDLLWNAGIGTYVKASAESHTDAGDKSNDAVRVNADELRVAVIGEGGNLGLTALGRVEFARRGGRITSDAFDNSAGVNCSDHEVNIKILLDSAEADGISVGDRDQLLRDMTEEVAELVLRENFSQNIQLGLCRAEADAMAGVHRRVLSALESGHGIDRQLEALPSDADMRRRIAEGRGLTSPELANLLAHVKLSLKANLLSGKLPDSAAFAAVLPTYFPAPLRGRYGAAIRCHPLRREIVATTLINDMVDFGGLAYAFLLAEQNGVTTDDAVRAFTAAAAIFELHSLWQRIRTTPMPTATRDELELETRRTLVRAARWLLATRPQPLAVDADITRYRSGIHALTTIVPVRHDSSADRLSRSAIERGAPRELAEQVFRLIHLFPLLDVVDIAEIMDQDSDGVARLYFSLADHFEIERLLNAIGELDRGDRWQSLARLSVRDELYASLRLLTMDVLRAAESSDSAAEKIAYWESVNRHRIERSRTVLDEIVTAATCDLAQLSVAAQQVRSMVAGRETEVSATSTS